MNFILSKIISRPKSAILSSSSSSPSADSGGNSRMDNTEIKPITPPASTRPLSLPPSAQTLSSSSSNSVQNELLQHQHQQQQTLNKSTATNVIPITTNTDNIIETDLKISQQSVPCLESNENCILKVTNTDDNDENKKLVNTNVHDNNNDDGNNGNKEVIKNKSEKRISEHFENSNNRSITVEQKKENSKQEEEIAIKTVTEIIDKAINEDTLLILQAKNDYIKKELNYNNTEKSNGILNEKNHINETINVLPDIINIQPTIRESDDNLKDDNLNCLNSNLSKDTNYLNLPSPTTNYDGISSDDELYIECQTFHETTSTSSLPSITITSTSTSLYNANDDIQSINSNLTYDCNSNDFTDANSTINLTLNKDDVIVVSEKICENVDEKLAECSKIPDENGIETMKSSMLDKNENQKDPDNALKKTFNNDNSTSDDSNLDVYIPQVLLRQKDKLSTDSLESDLDSKTISLENTRNSTSLSSISTSNSVFTKENPNEISGNLNFNFNNLKISNRTFDNIEESQRSSRNSINQNELSNSITFAVSSEALNSTVNLTQQQEKQQHEIKHNQQKMINGDLSFGTDGETSFNYDETLPIDQMIFSSEITQTPEIKTLSSRKSILSQNGDQIEKEEKINDEMKTSITKDFSSSLPIEATSLPKEQEGCQQINTPNTSMEPMDVDVSLTSSPQQQHQQQEECISPFDQSEIEKSEVEKQQSSEIKEFPKTDPHIGFPIMGNLNSSNIDLNFEFKTLTFPASLNIENRTFNNNINDDENFQSGLILSEADFDFLLSKGDCNNKLPPNNRNSILLRFDPLLGHSVPFNQQQQPQEQQQQEFGKSLNLLSLLVPQHKGIKLNSTIIEENDNDLVERQQSISINKENLSLSQNENQNDLNVTINPDNIPENISTSLQQQTRPINNNKILNSKSQDKKGDDKMSVDVIHDIQIEKNNSDVNKSIDNLNKHTSEEKQDYKMEDLEKKIKNEVLKTEDIEKKLKDAEQREEALIKRITEKDKTIGKMSGVIEAYEKTLAKLIAEKEQIKQNYEKQIAELKADSDLNYQHLLSLETTFSDLHVKYERSKQNAEKLQKCKEDLLEEKKKITENLRLQEERYEKMKSYAYQQLETASNKFDSINKNHSAEVTKLKALLKKEEISRLSMAEQLQQKVRENEELMKICDELINGQGS